MAAICGLASSLAWGAGDFAGGLASRRGNTLSVVLFSQLIGGLLLTLLALVYAPTVPPLRHLAYGALAGIFGVLGLTGLYRGLAQGRMGLVAPLSAVVTALVPLTFSFIIEGFPGTLRMTGFAVAVAAVWFLASPGSMGSIEAQEIRLALLAGLGFGLFFIFMDQASDQAVLWPLVAARGAAIGVMSAILAFTRQLASPPGGQLFFIALAGILDTAGNAAFGMAAHLGRLDIAAILASLYPATTVILARLVFKERLGRQQWVGVGAAGIALLLLAV